MATWKIQGETVRTLRELCHFTREGLAMHAALSGGAAEVAAIERGALRCGDGAAERIARALGVEVEALLEPDPPGGDG